MNHYFIDVWYGDILLENTAGHINDEQFWPVLDEQEKKRALLFKREELQKKYIKTRAVLKKVLARYVKVEPRQIKIETAEYGKPFITTNSKLYFNLSHQGNRFVIAVSNIDELGIDIELSRKRKSLSDLVNKCFSDKEANFWHSLPKEQQTNMFYQFWVRKEAFVKATGRGISEGLNNCVIDPDNQSCFLSIPTAYGLAEQWQILNVKLNDDDVCVLVLKNEVEYKFKQTQWQ